MISATRTTACQTRKALLWQSRTDWLHCGEWSDQLVATIKRFHTITLSLVLYYYLIPLGGCVPVCSNFLIAYNSITILLVCKFWTTAAPSRVTFLVILMTSLLLFT